MFDVLLLSGISGLLFAASSLVLLPVSVVLSVLSYVCYWSVLVALLCNILCIFSSLRVSPFCYDFS